MEIKSQIESKFEGLSYQLLHDFDAKEIHEKLFKLKIFQVLEKSVTSLLGVTKDLIS